MAVIKVGTASESESAHPIVIETKGSRIGLRSGTSTVVVGIPPDLSVLSMDEGPEFIRSVGRLNPDGIVVHRSYFDFDGPTGPDELETF